MSKPANYDAMDAETVAELLGVSDRMLRNYVNKNGLPVSGDKRGRTFRWSEVREWFVDYRVSLASPDGNRGNTTVKIAPSPSVESSDGPPQSPPAEKYKDALTRKIIAEADLKEIERALRRRELIAVNDAKVILDRVFANVKQKMLGVPAKLAGRLDGIKDKAQRKAILDAEINQVCQEMSVEGALAAAAEVTSAAK